MGGNKIVDKGKGGGPRSHDNGKVVADELGDLDASMSGGGGCYGNQAKFCEGQDKVTFANKGGRNRDEEEWYNRKIDEKSAIHYSFLKEEKQKQNSSHLD